MTETLEPRPNFQQVRETARIKRGIRPGPDADQQVSGSRCHADQEREQLSYGLAFA